MTSVWQQLMSGSSQQIPWKLRRSHAQAQTTTRATKGGFHQPETEATEEETLL